MIEHLALLMTAFLFGGMLLYSFGFAPLIFHSLQKEEAGALIRTAFPWYYIFIVTVSSASSIAFFLLDSSSAFFMAAIAIIGLYSRQILMPQINRARDLNTSSGALWRRRFDLLHAVAVFLNGVQVLAAGYILVQFL